MDTHRTNSFLSGVTDIPLLHLFQTWDGRNEEVGSKSKTQYDNNNTGRCI